MLVQLGEYQGEGQLLSPDNSRHKRVSAWVLPSMSCCVGLGWCRRMDTGQAACLPGSDVHRTQPGVVHAADRQRARALVVEGVGVGHAAGLGGGGHAVGGQHQVGALHLDRAVRSGNRVDADGGRGRLNRLTRTAKSDEQHVQDAATREAFQGQRQCLSRRCSLP